MFEVGFLLVSFENVKKISRNYFRFAYLFQRSIAKRNVSKALAPTLIKISLKIEELDLLFRSSSQEIIIIKKKNWNNIIREEN